MNEWRIQYDAVLRLNLYTVGKTHQLLNRAVSEMRGLILGAADSGGNLTPLLCRHGRARRCRGADHRGRTPGQPRQQPQCQRERRRRV
jgi:hypothetical protein